MKSAAPQPRRTKKSDGYGIKCPVCGDNNTHVTDSRAGKDAVRRRRKCLKCSFRFSTWERTGTPMCNADIKAARRSHAAVMRFLEQLSAFTEE